MKQKEPFIVITSPDVCMLKHALNHYLLNNDVIDKETIHQGEALLRKLYQLESNLLKMVNYLLIIYRRTKMNIFKEIINLYKGGRK